MEEVILSLDHVSYLYQSDQDETLALSDLSFSLKRGEFVSLVGPSGCGKSTILALLSGLITPTEGTVTTKGKIGLMFQQDELLEWRSILKNVLLAPEIQGSISEEVLSYVHDLLKRCDLWEFRNFLPSALSGGMRQRAALIRTLAARPDVLLLDEPFSALDYQTRLTVSDQVSRIIRDEGKTALLVTHDISEAISLSDRIIVLTGRPASVKTEHRLSFPSDSDAPLARRNSPVFPGYFNQIWKELAFDG